MRRAISSTPPQYLISFLLVVLLYSAGHAQDRCDCSVKVGTCQAAISLTEKAFTLTSNTAQCSHFEWVLDGKPKTTIVMDGKGVEQRPAGKAHPDFWLKGCYVCADLKFPDGAKASVTEKQAPAAGLIGKWCAQGDREKAAYTIAPDGVTTTFALGRTGRKFDRFSCNSSFSQCVGEINGINNFIRGEGIVNLRYTYAVKTPESGTLVIERVSAADGKLLGTTTATLVRCQ